VRHGLAGAVFQLRYVRGAICTSCSDSVLQTCSVRPQISEGGPSSRAKKIEAARLRNPVGLLEIPHLALEIAKSAAAQQSWRLSLLGIDLGLHVRDGVAVVNASSDRLVARSWVSCNQELHGLDTCDWLPQYLSYEPRRWHGLRCRPRERQPRR
jgi:hypothetical protein